MSKSHPHDDELEYYTAKQSAGQLDSLPAEEKKSAKRKPVKFSNDQENLRSASEGYVPMKKADEQRERDFERYQEVTFAQKASDRAKQNPLIPIGMLATIAALTMGLRAVSRGDKWQSQMMMRARIGAQGFTIFAVLASIMYAGQTQRYVPVSPPPKTRPSKPSSTSS